MGKAAELLLSGQVASPGLALGPVVRLSEASVRQRRQGSIEEESAALEAALAAAGAGLAQLIEKLEATGDEAGAEVLLFQQALLEDDDLLLPIHQAIAGGAAADAAWGTAMAREAAHYAAADDETFRARAADLQRPAAARARRLPPGGRRHGRCRSGPLLLVAEDLTPSRFLEIDWHALPRRGAGRRHRRPVTSPCWRARAACRC